MIWWWFVLYYLIVAALIPIGMRIERRYPPNSTERERAEVGLGCAFISIPLMPVVVGALYLARRVLMAAFG